MNAKARSILEALRNTPGMYAPDICKATGIWRITIYTRLSDLVDAGYVAEGHEIGSAAPLSRTKHFITEAGIKALRVA